MPDDEKARLQREAEFFDASSAAQFSAELPLPNHHMRMLFDQLGNAAGMRILDCGCGAGELALEVARDAKQVVGFDLSLESVKLMRVHAQRLGVAPPGALTSVMERLPFDDASFDAVIGKSILHHVDVAAAMAEVERVLKPGARAIFIENQLTNPLLRFARNKLTGRYGVARLGTLDEHPLLRNDLDSIAARFESMRLTYPDFRFFDLFSRNVLRYRRAQWLAKWLHRLDELIYRRLPTLRRFGYHVIVEVRRSA
jgi:ubiquinone/menaquinone biosynthesis C-methylase UbiE